MDMRIQLTSLPGLDDDQSRRFRELAAALDRSALLWLSGYLAGCAEQGEAAVAGVNASPASPLPSKAQDATVTVLYGSQTGNAKRIAIKLFEQLRAAGVNARLCGADTYSTRELKQERCLFVVISTQGDGDPPDQARDLMSFLQGVRAPRLESLQYAILALGDSSYPQFCLIGRQVDERLEALGARRLLPLGESDVDLETVCEPWMKQVVAQAQSAAPSTEVNPPASRSSETPSEAASFTRAKPFRAQILTNQRITGRGSDRDVRHVELLLEGSGISYLPGDALGVWPLQADALVDEVLGSLRLDGNQVVSYKEQSLPLRAWLKEKRELTALTRPFLSAHAERCSSAFLREALEPDQRERLAQMMQTWQLPDLLSHHPAPWTPEELVASLRPLAPRMYSIASSPRLTDGEEVHLTLAKVDYQYENAHRWGVASHYLADCEENTSVDIFIEANERFRLPEDPQRDIIMIGPGTGVAPFRAFVQDRAATGAAGRNWLFFGNRHFRSEFLYQAEWQLALADGRLHRLDLAFSRDTADRCYVQQRMLEQAAELYAWLEQGAYLYVCGDASRMAPDVHEALRQIGMKQGSLSEENASQWLEQLVRDGRYVRDIY